MKKHSIEEIKELIIDVENENKNLYESLEVYPKEDLPPIGKTLLNEINKNNERISSLNERLFELIEKKPVGRPPVGKTKRVALTLPTDLWDKIENDREEEGISLAAFLRDIVEYHYYFSRKDDE